MSPRTPRIPSNDDNVSVAKIKYGDKAYKYPIPHSVLTRQSLPPFMAALLSIPDSNPFTISRFSKSAKSWCLLDSPASYVQLSRALSVQRRLRLHVITSNPVEASDEPQTSKISDKAPEPASSSIAVEELTEKLKDFAEAEAEPGTEPNETGDKNSFDAFSEKLLEKISNLLASKTDFLDNIGELIASSTPVMAGVVDQLVKEIQSKVVDTKDFQDKIQAEISAVVDQVTKDIQAKVIDAKDFQDKLQTEVAKHVQEKVAAVRKARKEAKQAFQSTFAEPKDFMKNIHDGLQAHLHDYVKQQDFYVPGAFPDAPFPQQTSYTQRDSRDYSWTRGPDIIVYCDLCNEQVFGERHKCLGCPDYDLCNKCMPLRGTKHDRSHTFETITMKPPFSPPATSRDQSPTMEYMDVTCDGCDNIIVEGIRHKCLSCPDYDLCEECILNRHFIHEGHTFVKIRDEDDLVLGIPEVKPIHHGVECDGGALCTSGSGYIQGVRYKCTSCVDYDLCASCEANPATKHDASHIFVKLRQPVHLSTEIFGSLSQSEAAPPVSSVPVERATEGSPTQNAMHVDTEMTSSVTLTEPEPEVTEVEAEPESTASSVSIQAATVSVRIISRTTASSVMSIDLKNVGTTVWPAETYLSSMDRSLGVTSSSSFITSPGQGHSFVLASHSPATLEDVYAADWRLVSPEFDCSVTITSEREGEELRAEPVSVESEPTSSANLSSSEVILPRFPVETPSLGASKEILTTRSQNSNGSFYSAASSGRTSQEAMKNFMSSNRFDSVHSPNTASVSSLSVEDEDDDDVEKITAEDAKSDQSVTAPNSPELVSVTASSSVMDASISGPEDDEDDMELDEDDMFTDSDYELIESDMLDD